MLTTSIIASIQHPKKSPSTSHIKDIGIFTFQTHPRTTQTASYKKSATPVNSLAVSETHIYAAQSDKAVIHVYNREKGNLEAIVPFPESITSIALTVGDSVLILGTSGGGVFLWEVCSGRLVAAAAAHLQKITALAVEEAALFFLSGSSDSSIHVWSVRNLLSFSAGGISKRTGVDTRQPVRSLSNHRGEILSLVCGRGLTASNIAVSASADKSVVVWNYHAGFALHTVLLEDVPRALALDSLSRGFFVGYDDGSVQLVDFFASLGEGGAQSIADSGREEQVTQPGSRNRWRLNSKESEESSLGPVLSLLLDWEGTRVYSGHENGGITEWRVSNGRCSPGLATLPGPVTNLHSLPIRVPGKGQRQRNKLHAVVKPRMGALDDVTASCPVPQSYSYASQFSQDRFDSATQSADEDFEQLLTSATLPQSLLQEGLAELTAIAHAPTTSQPTEPEETQDFMSLDMPAEAPQRKTIEDENVDLRSQVQSLQEVGRSTLKTIKRLRIERDLMMRERGEERSKHEQAMRDVRGRRAGLVQRERDMVGSGVVTQNGGNGVNRGDGDSNMGGEERGWDTDSSDRG